MKHHPVAYTLVRHSAWSVHENPQFEAAVEERAIFTAKERKAVAGAGGLLLDEYGAAHDRAYEENYPDKEGSTTYGIIPNARGRFVKRAGMDEEIYVPRG